jgi:O-antigen/teichoic acid export membrane protein
MAQEETVHQKFSRARSSFRGLLPHGSAVAQIGLVSVLGIAASFGFQIVTARFLGPSDFGVLSAFFSIVSMAAIGSSSLQNSVAVQTARSIGHPKLSTVKRKRLDGFTIEALTLGGTGALIVAAASPVIVTELRTEFFVPLLAAVSIVLSFVFARAVGTIQGVGDSRSAVWWSSISLVLRLALVAVAFVAGFGLVGALAAVLIASGLVMMGAFIHSLRLHAIDGYIPFRLEGIIVMLMSVAFAWLTNIDVILVRAFDSEHSAGIYAASATLVKSGFLIPATLSLYLLPRFVRQEKNAAMTQLGVRLTLLVTGVGGFVMFFAFSLVGPWLTTLLFGSEYNISGALLSGLSLAYLPWMMAHGLLIRMNALVSKLAFATLACAVVFQLVAAIIFLPNITALLVIIGVVGAIVLVSFLFIDRSRSAGIVATPQPPSAVAP